MIYELRLNADYLDNLNIFKMIKNVLFQNYLNCISFFIYLNYVKNRHAIIIVSWKILW